MNDNKSNKNTKGEMSIEEDIETQEESYNKSEDNKNFETGSIRK